MADILVLAATKGTVSESHPAGSSSSLSGVNGIHWIPCLVIRSGSNQLKALALEANKMVATLTAVMPFEGEPSATWGQRGGRGSSPR